MLYPFVTFPNGTEIVYSDVFHKENDSTDYVRVEIERVNTKKNKFDYIEYIIPSGEIVTTNGFTSDEIQEYITSINKLSDVIIECALEEENRY